MSLKTENRSGTSEPLDFSSASKTRTVHRAVGFFVFFTALLLYTLTMSPTVSFWDCGEFIASSATMSVPHPPGAPFFLLLGRLSSMLPFFADMAARINFISVLTSALTVLLLYLTVVHLLRYWHKDRLPGMGEIAGAAIGALTFMGSDSFWFNAVEAEVYAISMLFTALVVWLAFVWHDMEARGNHDGDRILLFIFYLVGLALGVHLLNVLALPLVFLVIYFHWRKDQVLDANHFLLFWALAVLSILPVFPGVVLWMPKLIYLAAQSMGDGMAIALLLTILVGLGVLHMQMRRVGNRTLALASAAMLLVLLGYLSYLLIILRSGLNPPLDENDPQTLLGLIRYLGREQYGTEGIVTQLFNRKAPFWDYQVVKMYVRYFNWNFVGHNFTTDAWNYQLFGLPLLMGLWGMITHFARDWRRAFTVSNLFILTGIAIVLYLNQDDPQPRERDYSYVGSFYAFALWIGMGAAAILDDLRKYTGKAAVIVVPIVVVAMTVALPYHVVKANYFTHDRSQRFVAWDYASNSLEMLEQDAIIFTNGDNDTFPLWYLQIVENIRPDVRVVNLSLLNTGWYIRQLRDMEPRVPLPAAMTDDFIDQRIDGQADPAVQWRYWGPILWSQVPEESRYQVPMTDAQGATYKIRVKPTMHVPLGDEATGPNFLRVQDRMILEIVKANDWNRPIYFTVTVAHKNFCGLDRNLRMDGLAYRVMDSPQRYQLDRTLLDRNLQIFEGAFRGLNQEGIYYDDNIQRLVQNYRSAYIQLALSWQEAGNSPASLAVLQRMDTYLPESIVQPMSVQMSLQLGVLFHDLGDPEGLERRLLSLVKREDVSFNDRFALATAWIDPLGDVQRGYDLLQPMAEEDKSGEVRFELALILDEQGELELALEEARRYCLDHPDKSDGVQLMVRILDKSGHLQEALDTLDIWLKVHPDDYKLQSLRQSLVARLSQDGSPS
jgi:tetratricopeptide (TPR) repeat protein